MNTTFAIAWTEFDRNDSLVSKRREFKTEVAMVKFGMRLEDKANFNEIIGFSYPVTRIK